jgi:hypothetical protein
MFSTILRMLDRLIALPVQLQSLEKKLMATKDELIALISQRADQTADLVVAEKAEVTAALDNLNSTIEQLKAQLEQGLDLSAVVEALDAASSRVNSAIQDVYTPDAPTPEQPVPTSDQMQTGIDSDGNPIFVPITTPDTSVDVPGPITPPETSDAPSESTPATEGDVVVSPGEMQPIPDRYVPGMEGTLPDPNAEV